MKSLRVRASLLSLGMSAASVVIGQTGNVVTLPSRDSHPESWQRFVSVSDRFTAVFPGSPKLKLSEKTISYPPTKVVIHNLYVESSGSVYSVMYGDYPKEMIEGRAANVILNQAANQSAKETNSRLLSVSAIKVNGYPGRLMKQVAADGTIIRVKAVLVGQRIYEISIATPREDGATPELVAFYNSTSEKFLESFDIIDSPLSAGPDPEISHDGSCPPNVTNCITMAADVLRSKAISLPQSYPAIARSVRATGTVEVAVLIDEQGAVISAMAIRGHPLLQAAAVSAARNARFTPTRVDSKPVKVSGVIKYEFVLQ